MDIKLEKKKGWRALFQKKNLPYAFAGAFVIFVAWLLLCAVVIGVVYLLVSRRKPAAGGDGEAGENRD